MLELTAKVSSGTCFHVQRVYNVKCVFIQINCTECAEMRQRDRGYRANKIKAVKVLNPHVKLQQSKNDFSLVCMRTANQYCQG